MVADLEYPPGATPLDPDEAAGLIPSHISTQSQLNEWEQMNIADGRHWGTRQADRHTPLLTESFVRQLHQKMFDQTWQWAGTFRNTDKNIGKPWEQVSIALRQLLDNTIWQIEHQVFPAEEIAVRFHHALVLIHPFPNGNGRHARLMADLLNLQLGQPPLTWGGDNLVDSNRVRDDYLSALRAADQGNFIPRLAFTRRACH